MTARRSLIEIEWSLKRNSGFGWVAHGVEEILQRFEPGIFQHPQARHLRLKVFQEGSVQSLLSRVLQPGPRVLVLTTDIGPTGKHLSKFTLTFGIGH